ncbi:MAG: DUF2934 domain-containing protein [Nitrospirota bacterium]
MSLYDEIAKLAYEIYEKSGYIPNRDLENWLEAEKIVMARYAAQQKTHPEAVQEEKKESPRRVTKSTQTQKTSKTTTAKKKK